MDLQLTHESTIALLLNQDNFENIAAARTNEENYRLFFRRGFGIFINFCVIAAGWTAIVSANIYQASIVSTLASYVSSLSSVGNFITPVVVSLVNVIVPTCTFAITEFEQVFLYYFIY